MEMVLRGGGFLVSGGSRLTIVDSNITDIIGGSLGGVFAMDGGVLEISRSHIEGATAGFLGALIAGCCGASITMRDSVVCNIGTHDSWSWNGITLWNGAMFGGGLLSGGPPTLTVSGCRFVDSPKGVFYLANVSPPPPSPTHHLTGLHQPFSAQQPFSARPLTSLSSCARFLVTGIGCRRQLPL